MPAAGRKPRPTALQAVGQNKKGESEFMRKAIVLGALTAAMTLSLGMTAFAAQWQEDDFGWWWQNDDGSYPVSQWPRRGGNGEGTAGCHLFSECDYY